MRSSCCLCVPIFSALLFAGSITAPAAAQVNPRFGTKEISTAPLTGVKHVIAHAINKSAWVVGEITFTANSETHAFFYLPVTRAGLPAGMYDLHELANLSGTHSVAWDINDNGLIVGEAGGGAHVWDIIGYTGEPSHQN